MAEEKCTYYIFFYCDLGGNLCRRKKKRRRKRCENKEQFPKVGKNERGLSKEKQRRKWRLTRNESLIFWFLFLCSYLDFSPKMFITARASAQPAWRDMYKYIYIAFYSCCLYFYHQKKAPTNRKWKWNGTSLSFISLSLGFHSVVEIIRKTENWFKTESNEYVKKK